MKMRKAFTFALFAVSLLIPNVRGQEVARQKQEAPKENPAAKKDEFVPEKVVSEKEAIKQLIGSYRIVSGEKSGEQILPERLAEVTVRITEKTITTYDGDRQQRFSANYRLETLQRPWRIKMVSTTNPGSNANPNNAAAGQNANSTPATAAPSEGLIEVTEKGAKVIYALPNGETPKRFTTAARQQLFILERLADPSEKPQAAAPSPTSEGSKSDK